MRVFKISAYNMEHWQWQYNFETRQFESNEIIPGMRVCSAAKLAHIGVITDMGKKERKFYGSDRTYVLTATVLWLTGPHKGKSQVKQTKQLANFEAYRQAVQRHYNELNAYVDEANRTGM